MTRAHNSITTAIRAVIPNTTIGVIRCLRGWFSFIVVESWADPGGLFVALAAFAGYFLVFVACLVDSFVGEIAERFADFLTRAGRYQGSDSGTQYQTADECCDTSCIFHNREVLVRSKELQISDRSCGL